MSQLGLQLTSPATHHSCGFGAALHVRATVCFLQADSFFFRKETFHHSGIQTLYVPGRVSEHRQVLTRSCVLYKLYVQSAANQHMMNG